ncbi:MAG: hypothetical protein PVF58_14810 [Candidatus Methanofastidiosia archaeon]|jgi:hypothetical protein
MVKELDPNEILCREFEYAAQSAFQANEDRVRVFNYYLATMGTMIAASVFADLTNSMYLEVFGLAIGILAILGFIFVLKLIKLRMSWKESVQAMCKIKEYYIENYDESLKKAFEWKSKTIPSVGKINSVAFLMGLIIMTLSSASAAGAVYFWGKALEKIWDSWSIKVGTIVFMGQILV